MRSLKKLLAVLIALTLMASVMVVPAFAAESFEYEDEAKALYDLGLFKGTSTTEYKPALDARLERQEGAVLVLRLFNLEEEANKMDEKEAKALLAEKFKDADEIGAWAVKAIAYAVKNEIINGRPDGKFAPKDPLLGKEFAKMILAELGQKYDFQTACADLASVSDLTAAEAIKFNDKILIRDDVVGISFASLAGTYADGKTVLQVLSENAEFKAKAMEIGLIKIVKINTVVEPISIKVGEKVELPAKAEVEYSDGSKAEVALTWDTAAVKTDVAGEYKAVGSVAGFDGKVEVAISVAEGVLKVDSVTATNLKEIVVVYNQDISENTEAAKKDNYTLDIGKKVTAVKVDGNTAVLTVEDGVANQKKTKLTVANKILAAKEVIEFTFFDAELPEVNDLVVTGPKSVELSFSEPISKVNNFTDVKVTIKSGTSTISINKGAITGEGTRTISVPLYSSLVDGKEYQVTVEGFVDYAGYKNKIETFTLAYAKDTTAPVATIDAATQEYVKVSFNKPVTGLTAGHFSHTFSAWTAIKLTSGDTFDSTAITSADSVKTVYVWFYKDGARAEKDERPIAEGDTSFRILTKANSKEIADAWSNKFVEATYTITVAADKTAPEVKEIKVTSEQAFTVEFTKTVNFKYSDNLEVLDAEGKAITGLNVSVTPTTAAKKFTVDLGKNLKGKSIIVNIKNVKDTTLNTNKLDSYSTTLEIADKTAPKLTKVSYEQVGAGDDASWYLYAFFDEDVDSDTALNSANYFIKNVDVYTKLTKTAEFYAGNKVVKITLTSDEKGLIDLVAGTELFVTSVKDIAGNEINPIVSAANKIISLNDNQNAPSMAKAEATARDKVVVTFNEELSTYDMSAFRVNGKGIAALDASLNSDGKTVLTLTLDGDARLPYTYTTDLYNVTIVEENKEAVKNLFGVSPVALSKGITDKIKPQLIADTDDLKAIRTGAAAGTIEIEFTEDLLNANTALIATDLVVTRKSDAKTLEAGTAYTVAVEGKKLVVTITGGVQNDTEYKIYSKDAITYIKDALAGNVAEVFNTVKEVTVKAPVAPAQ